MQNSVPETVVRRHPWLWSLLVASLDNPSINKTESLQVSRTSANPSKFSSVLGLCVSAFELLELVKMPVDGWSPVHQCVTAWVSDCVHANISAVRLHLAGSRCPLVFRRRPSVLKTPWPHKVPLRRTIGNKELRKDKERKEGRTIGNKEWRKDKREKWRKERKKNERIDDKAITSGCKKDKKTLPDLSNWIKTNTFKTSLLLLTRVNQSCCFFLPSFILQSSPCYTPRSHWVILFPYLRRQRRLALISRLAQTAGPVMARSCKYFEAPRDLTIGGFGDEK